MRRLFTTDYRDCPAVGHSVCVRRTEQECRAGNGCTNDACPMAGEFSEAPVAAPAPEFSSRIGLGALAGRIGG